MLLKSRNRIPGQAEMPLPISGKKVKEAVIKSSTRQKRTALEANNQGGSGISPGQHTTIADVVRNAPLFEGAQYVEVL